MNRRSCCLFDFLINVIKEIIIKELPQGNTQPIAELIWIISATKLKRALMI